MPVISSGAVVLSTFTYGTCVLLVHPSGQKLAKGTWGIPKGEVEPSEDYAVTAVRETKEETGLDISIVLPLGSITYKSGRKTVFGFLAVPVGPVSHVLVPPSWEVDRVEFFPIAEAKRWIHRDQAELIDRAMVQIGTGK
jgi:predicted NUDIX family NTP pyrophosphohydrolase